MTRLEERVSYLEGAYRHLATKSELADLKAELLKELPPLIASALRDQRGADADREPKGRMGFDTGRGPRPKEHFTPRDEGIDAS